MGVSHTHTHTLYYLYNNLQVANELIVPQNKIMITFSYYKVAHFCLLFLN